MVIENMMYFALGLLVAGLGALIILPAVWKRAVRLTKRRIEAATPITMAEFRADKDQLRAEFALSTRKLEMNVETLRGRLAEQLGDVNQKRSDLGALKAEREQHVSIVGELEARNAEATARLAELEREGTDLAQRLRMRERDFEARGEEVSKLRDTLRDGIPRDTQLDADTLSGDYDEDVDRLTTALAVERKRVGFLEDQAKSLISRLETSDRRSAEASDAIAKMRDALAGSDDKKAAAAENLSAAEARIASAEKSLTSLLTETGRVVELPGATSEPLLADQLRREADVENLRKQVANVEVTILADWDTERMDEGKLRDRLAEIAASVSGLVYAADKEAPVARVEEESLFDRVQRFADEVVAEAAPVRQPKRERKGNVSDRMAALREIQAR
ncbi:hypothetical protein [Devosia sp. 2618]|uniref:hypothetical protein n=1 Tax=Devosia sp. 2618 TaxID=3156454 RepID=UPI0033998DA0